MNRHFINNANVNNNSDNTTETEFQFCMSDSITKSYNSFFSDEHLPKGHITNHPFSFTLEELSGLLNLGQENHKNSPTPQLKPHKDYSGSTDYSGEKFQSKPAEDIECLNQSKIPGQLNSKKYKTPQTKLNRESSLPTDYSVGKFSHKLVEDSRKNNKSTSIGQLSDGLINCEKTQPLETLPHEDSSFPTDYSVGKLLTKPVGGSGWLHKYTNLKETKTGLVEYPRVKEGQRSHNNPKHWYWNYCWHKKGKNGKPLYKKGKAVVSSVGCPQKKVRVIEGTIASKLPHRQILEIIKGDNSPPPPT